MENVPNKFEKLDRVTPDDIMKGEINPRYEHVNVHMIFDISMEWKFIRKSILVSDGYTTASPSSITYSSVVSWESVRIIFLLEYFNNLDIFACDIGNAQLNVKCREKLLKEAGTEFGTKKGMVIIIGRALYGLKSSGDTWRGEIEDTLMLLGYKSSEADAEVWL